MRKYLTQHRFNALTIKIPRNILILDQVDISFEMGSVTSSERMLFIRFVDFIQSKSSIGFDKLPVFNFLLTFYDVVLVKETDEILKFRLILNKELNESMWFRLKHAVFNQYNALIGFSEILKEIKKLEEAEHLLIRRINDSAHAMFKNTKLLLVIEQIKDINYELNAKLVSPIEFLSSYLKYGSFMEKKIPISFDKSGFENISISIVSELFKETLDLFFNILENLVDLSKVNFKLILKQHCHLRLECDLNLIKDAEFIHEQRLISDFFERGINLKQLNNRLFYLLYIRIIAEKFGGTFNIEFKTSSNSILSAEWIFPVVRIQTNLNTEIQFDEANYDLEIESLKLGQQYPIELRKEIATHFSTVDGTFVLDDLKIFASKLDTICSKYNVNELGELRQIISDIRKAIDSFDVTVLQLIMSKLKLISKVE